MRLDVGLPPIPQNILATYVGKGVEQLVMRALGHEGTPASVETVMRGLARYRDHYRKRNGDQSHPYPGVLGGLQAFRATGANLPGVTNQNTPFTTPLPPKPEHRRGGT